VHVQIAGYRRNIEERAQIQRRRESDHQERQEQERQPKKKLLRGAASVALGSSLARVAVAI
jgi:hypothetical protein